MPKTTKKKSSSSKRSKITKNSKKSSKTKEMSKHNGKGHFRISIFGSARIKRSDTNYKKVQVLAKLLGKEGFDVITGGGPGLMEAANKGHKEGQKLFCKSKEYCENKPHSIGLNIKLPKEQYLNKHLDLKKDFKHFSNRLDTFMQLSSVVVVAPGGIGTLLELLYTWQLVQVKHLCETPIILLDDMYLPLIDWIKDCMLRKKLISKGDLNNIFHVKNPTKATKLIKTIYQAKKETKGHICSNFTKYKKIFK